MPRRLKISSDTCWISSTGIYSELIPGLEVIIQVSSGMSLISVTKVSTLISITKGEVREREKVTERLTQDVSA